jgi:methylmalonyl-CoA/ethylmalonyl-CoA epimerase
MSDGPGIERIGQLAIPVAGLERAVAFYSDVLELRLLFRAPPGLAFFECGGVRLMLSRPEGADTPARAGLLYYLVPDIAAAHAALVERGVIFVQPPRLVARLSDHELWLALCHDSEDNLLALMSEMRPLP